MNIYDIAKKAEVSIATVSRVLNGGANVSERTRQRVTEVMRQEGYTPNAFARGLGLGSMRMIGVMCTDLTDSFYAAAVSNIEKLLKKQNRDIVLRCTGGKLSDKKTELAALVEQRVDAVILIGSAFKEKTDNSHIREAAAHIPVIIINGLISLPNVYCVVCDERGAVYENTVRLAGEGCNVILYLYDSDTFSGNEKLRGYSEGCEAAKLERLCERVPRSVAAVNERLSELADKGIHFDAVMTSEDVIAAAALNFLRGRNITIPVIGFNNSIIAECTRPALTSVDNMVGAMCDTAANLLETLAGGKSAPGKTVISARLIRRESY